jgi:long-chain fatty acid transport protein
MRFKPSRGQLGLLIGSALAATSINTQASGFAIIEHSASGMGNAFAGAAAVAEDASTVYFNPAGLTNLSGSQLVAAGHIVAPSAQFNNKGSYVNPNLTDGMPIAGSLPGKDDDGGTTALVPNLYYATQINDQWFAGLGINAPFGLEVSYDDSWVGRYHATTSKLQTININPSIAFKANERFSVGAGISAQYIRATLSSAVDFGSVCLGIIDSNPMFGPGTCAGAGVMPLQADGQAKLKGSDWSWGFNLGAMFNISEATRVGLSYRSNIDHGVEGQATYRVPDNFQAILDMGVPVFSNTGASATVDVPESVSLSLFHQINDRFAILADATWTKWDRFEELKFEYDNPHQPPAVQPQNWENSMRYSLGMTYTHNEQLLFRVGTAYDETPIPSAEYRTPRIPGNDRTWLSFGVGYKFSKKLGMDLAYAHLFVDDSDINALDHSTGHQLVGTYEGAVDIFSAQLNMAF